MPKYTNINYPANRTLISSATWNKWFGTKGNLQWAYDNYENVSSLNAVSLRKGNVPAGPGLDIQRVVNYSFISGDTAYGDKASGTLTCPVSRGYVWLSATISYNGLPVYGPTESRPMFFAQFLPVTKTARTTLDETFVSLKSGFNPNYKNSSGSTTSGLYPTVPVGTLSGMYVVENGFPSFQVGVYRTDDAIASGRFVVESFTLLPLGDVSGLVNILENMTVIE